MYDADYERYLEATEKYLANPPGVYDDSPDYVTKDSGMKTLHSDGVQRDAESGKPRFDLIWPEDVPFDDQLLTRVAWLYERGAAKYGDRNWEKSETLETLNHHKAAFLRHVFKLYADVDDGEDHAAAVVWNVNAIILTQRKIKAKAEAQRATDRLFGRETAGDSADLDYLFDMAEKHGFELVDKQKALKEEQGPAGQPWTPADNNLLLHVEDNNEVCGRGCPVYEAMENIRKRLGEV